jgi:hypothetical protein
MPTQTELGKAFEYACLNSIYNVLKDNQNVSIQHTEPFQTAKDFYLNSTEGQKVKLDLASSAAIRVIIKLEPQLQSTSIKNPLYLGIQEDARGMLGDVRDVLCIKRENEWEIGISCKHNHSAVKHSRLSSTIDFGQEWLGIPCSKSYFEKIDPIFDELKILRNKGLRWNELVNKQQRFYIPVLNAFIDEIQELYSHYNEQVPNALLGYLLGRNDFYKVITVDRSKLTKIQAFNIYGTLNKPAKNMKPQIKVPQLTLPKRINSIRYKDKSATTVIIDCDNGWSVSMRIHNAATLVENSLKFDVNLQGIPPALYTNFEAW